MDRRRANPLEMEELSINGGLVHNDAPSLPLRPSLKAKFVWAVSSETSTLH
jgi:hypothetical protein